MKFLSHLLSGAAVVGIAAQAPDASAVVVQKKDKAKGKVTVILNDQEMVWFETNKLIALEFKGAYVQGKILKVKAPRATIEVPKRVYAALAPGDVLPTVQRTAKDVLPLIAPASSPGPFDEAVAGVEALRVRGNMISVETGDERATQSRVTENTEYYNRRKNSTTTVRLGHRFSRGVAGGLQFEESHATSKLEVVDLNSDADPTVSKDAEAQSVRSAFAAWQLGNFGIGLAYDHHVVDLISIKDTGTSMTPLRYGVARPSVLYFNDVLAAGLEYGSSSSVDVGSISFKTPAFIEVFSNVQTQGFRVEARIREILAAKSDPETSKNYPYATLIFGKHFDPWAGAELFLKYRGLSYKKQENADFGSLPSTGFGVRLIFGPRTGGPNLQVRVEQRTEKGTQKMPPQESATESATESTTLNLKETTMMAGFAVDI